MASRMQFVQVKNQIIFTALLIALISVFAMPAQAYALGEATPLPTLPTFIGNVVDGNENVLRGIYVADVMAFPVVQQPSGNPGYVSTTEATITQFGMASQFGNIGLLAHNYLAGYSFPQVKAGDTIVLIYGDGHTHSFTVEEVLSYQALTPYSPYSSFKDLQSGATLSAEELFNKVYRGDFHVTLQTCIDNAGVSSWGRLFIIAKPVTFKARDTFTTSHQGI